MAYGMDFFSSLFSGDFAGAATAFSTGLDDVSNFFSGMDQPVVGPTASTANMNLWPADFMEPANYVEAPGMGANAATALTTPTPTDSGFSLGSLLQQKGVMSALLTSGAALGKGLMEQSAADDNRDFQREENATQREFAREEREAAREERALDRSAAAEQAAAAREFQAKQAEEARRFNALMNLQNGRRNILMSRGQSRRGGGGGGGASFQPIVSALR